MISFIVALSFGQGPPGTAGSKGDDGPQGRAVSQLETKRGFGFMWEQLSSAASTLFAFQNRQETVGLI